MGNSDKTILVLGATGQQGGATTRHLLKRGFKVKAFTRDASSAAAKELASLGAEVVAGDMNDPQSLDVAMKGVYGVFSVQPPSWVPTLETDAKELALGIKVADAAKRANVKHLIYTSVVGADSQEKFRVAYKGTIEQHVWNTGLPATVMRPPAFMENYLGVVNGVMADPMAADKWVNLVAVDDIGYFAALAFDNPDDFVGKTFNFAGDRMTPPQMAKALSKALGTDIQYQQVPDAELRKVSELLGDIFVWFHEEGYPELDLGTLRKLHPGLLTFEAWLDREGAAKIKANWAQA